MADDRERETERPAAGDRDGERERDAESRGDGTLRSRDQETITLEAGGSGSTEIVFGSIPDHEEVPGEGEESTGRSLDVFATMPGSFEDHQPMLVDSERQHLMDAPGLVSRAGEGSTPPLGGRGLEPNQGAIETGYQRDAVTATPTSSWQRQDDQSPFATQGSADALKSDWSGGLANNPNVVGTSREEEALVASNPDLTGLVDMDAITNSQVGGTIDGRTPDGAGVGPTSDGFQSTSGWSGGDVLQGATSIVYTNPEAAAAKVQEGLAQYGSGNFFVHDAHTGQQIYGPGTHKDGGVNLGGGGNKGEYKISPVPATDSPGDNSAAPAPSTAPTNEQTATEQVAGALRSAGQTGTSNTEAARQLEQVDFGDDVTVPNNRDYDPETAPGTAPPPGLDLSKEWAIKVWAKENEAINPNPMAEGAQPAEVMDISDFTKQYEHATSHPTVDAEALVAAHNDKIGWEFDEAPDGGA